MKIYCQNCGHELSTTDTKFRKDGTKRCTRSCIRCGKSWVSEVYERCLGASYIEMETITKEGKSIDEN